MNKIKQICKNCGYKCSADIDLMYDNYCYKCGRMMCLPYKDEIKDEESGRITEDFIKDSMREDYANKNLTKK